MPFKLSLLIPIPSFENTALKQEVTPKKSCSHHLPEIFHMWGDPCEFKVRSCFIHGTTNDNYSCGNVILVEKEENVFKCLKVGVLADRECCFQEILRCYCK